MVSPHQLASLWASTNYSAGTPISSLLIGSPCCYAPSFVAGAVAYGCVPQSSTSAQFLSSLVYVASSPNPPACPRRYSKYRRPHFAFPLYTDTDPGGPAHNCIGTSQLNPRGLLWRSVGNSGGSYDPMRSSPGGLVWPKWPVNQWHLSLMVPNAAHEPACVVCVNPPAVPTI